jgi:uncharacterized membrane protein YfcA
MNRQDIQRTITFIIGGIVGLGITSILQEKNYFTWKTILTVTMIMIIGSWVGAKIRKAFDNRE